ncbi:MAG: GumC family protein [bacterium]
MHDPSLNAVQLRIAWYVLRSYRWKLLAFVCSTAAVVAVASILATPIYSASSRLLIKPGREDMYVSPAADAPAVMDRTTTQEQKLNSEIELLRSAVLASELIREMTPERLYHFPRRDPQGLAGVLGGWPSRNGNREIPPPKDVQKEIEKSLKFAIAPKSNVISIRFEWPDAEIAAEALNRFVDLYLTHHLRVHTNPATYDLLRNQAEKWDKELRRSEAELDDLKRRHSITSLADQKRMLLGRLSDTDAEKQRTVSEINETRRTVGALESQLAAMDRSDDVRQTVSQQPTALAALKAKLSELELQGLKEEVRRVKQMIAEEEGRGQVTTVSGENPVRQSLKTDLFKARAHLGALEAKAATKASQLADYRGELETLDRIEKELKELERQVAINEGNYKLCLTRLEEARITESMDQQKISNVSVIEKAVPPLEPVKPKKKSNTVIGAFLAMFAGTGLILLLEFANPVFRTREHVIQALGVPVLAVIPKIDNTAGSLSGDQPGNQERGRGRCR